MKHRHYQITTSCGTAYVFVSPHLIELTVVNPDLITAVNQQGSAQDVYLRRKAARMLVNGRRIKAACKRIDIHE